MGDGMKRLCTTCLLFTLLLILLIPAGCSEDSDNPVDPGPPSFHGTITSDGSGLMDVLVVVHDRLTNAKFFASTDANGRYSIEADEAVYDLGLFAEGYVTYFRGPMELGPDAIVFDYEMTPSTGLDAETISGELTLADGSVAANYTIEMSSFTADTSETSLATTTSADDGTFLLPVVGDMELDLDFSDSDGRLVEFIDIIKLAEPCQVSFVLGTGNVNVLRHHEAASPSGVSRGVKGPHATSEIDSSAGNIPFSCTGSGITYFPHPAYPFGQLGPDAGNMLVCANLIDSTSTNEVNIWVASDGDWCMPYALHVSNDGGNIPGTSRSYAGQYRAQSYFDQYWHDRCPSASMMPPLIYVDSPGEYSSSYGMISGSSDCGSDMPSTSHAATPAYDIWVKLVMIRLE